MVGGQLGEAVEEGGFAETGRSDDEDGKALLRGVREELLEAALFVTATYKWSILGHEDIIKGSQRDGKE